MFAGPRQSFIESRGRARPAAPRLGLGHGRCSVSEGAKEQNLQAAKESRMCLNNDGGEDVGGGNNDDEEEEEGFTPLTGTTVGRTNAEAALRNLLLSSRVLRTGLALGKSPQTRPAVGTLRSAL